jgi:hypothetical protein
MRHARAGVGAAQCVLLQNDGTTVDEFEGSIDAEMGLGDVPFREEEVERIGLALGQPEVVDNHGRAFRSVHTAQIHDQFTVDVRKYVIVTGERESLASLVRKGCVELEREVVIVRIAFVTKEFTIDGEEELVVVRVNAGTVGSDEGEGELLA